MITLKHIFVSKQKIVLIGKITKIVFIKDIKPYIHVCLNG